ncbi:putative D-xylose utilization operon transcriptional repressor [Streptomyces sp. RB5]|uniref:Putative D-xylose utilization operon transcriptional repressor n=1 Tax=Streptomyces smaragdinus TaxID=2585196 RepID=A0A7K0CHH3_9ACTN|nr:GntR family transcriptional regulator [Streptomyces smaragdinus]MQY12939.1 putative D-xylose utilization operon transcriptional repressor [Streptomyces smaragdinus]
MSGGSSHAVCTAIRDAIVAGHFPPGSRLTEEHLARRYGVSRVPVREALRTLESEGFVTTRRHVGACVAEPTAQDAADLLDIRALLEPLGAARAAERRTQAHLKVLHGLVRLGQERARRGQLPELAALGAWFHETLAQATGSPSLAAPLVQLRRKISWVYAGASHHRAVESWAEHGAITDAVTRGDAERARAVAALHVERSAAAYELRRPAGGVSSRKHSVNVSGERA